MNSFFHWIRKFGEFGYLINRIFQNQRIYLRHQRTQKGKKKRPVNHQPVRFYERNKLFVNVIKRDASLEWLRHND